MTQIVLPFENCERYREFEKSKRDKELVVRRNSIVKKISLIFLFGSSEATSSSLDQQGLLGGYLQEHLEGDFLSSHQGDHGGQLEGDQQARLEGLH